MPCYAARKIRGEHHRRADQGAGTAAGGGGPPGLRSETCGELAVSACTMPCYATRKIRGEHHRREDQGAGTAAGGGGPPGLRSGRTTPEGEGQAHCARAYRVTSRPGNLCRAGSLPGTPLVQLRIGEKQAVG